MTPAQGSVVAVTDNPKYSEGQKKLDYTCTPPVAEAVMAAAFVHGAGKYGRLNWRDTGVDERTYVAAIRRHLTAYVDGEPMDRESGVSHLGHIMASCGIMLDAMEYDTLEFNLRKVEVKSIPEDGKPSKR